MAEIPMDDKFGKDVTVNFKMFDGFNANKTFYTDSNGMEMINRKLDYSPAYHRPDGPGDFANISSNYYPVNTAIAMRDPAKNLQVTLMNDRTQGASAEL